MELIRNSVTENILSNPALVTTEDYKNYLTQHGKGWICEADGKLVGFAIVDLHDNNVWALFIKPGFEKKGIGKFLHVLMLEWYFSRTIITLWLTTSPQTRAETFYRMNGWKQTGINDKGEIRFEMGLTDWRAYRKELEKKYF